MQETINTTAFILSSAIAHDMSVDIYVLLQEADLHLFI
jgi:hypothetical protein